MKNIVSTALAVVFASMLAIGVNFISTIDGFTPTAQAKENEDRGREDERRGEDDFQCTPQQLSGNYGVLSTGDFITAPASLAGPFAAVGRLTVNANNRFSLTLRQNFNGTIFPAAAFTGEYTLATDCTGTLTIASQGIIFEFVVVDDGKKIQFMRTQDSPGTISVITGVATRQDDD